MLEFIKRGAVEKPLLRNYIYIYIQQERFRLMEFTKGHD